MIAAVVVAALLRRGETVAVAESLTGGLLAGAITDVPGASAVFRGAVVAYATDLKADLLGVDSDVLAAHGPVCGEVAIQMATGVRARLGAVWGLATTGVAGPDPQGDQPPGVVWLGLAGPSGSTAWLELIQGDRPFVRAGAVQAALVGLEARLVG